MLRNADQKVLITIDLKVAEAAFGWKGKVTLIRSIKYFMIFYRVCHGQDYRWSMAHPALHGMMEIVPHMRAVRLCLALYGVLISFWYCRQITTPCTVSRVADCDSGSV